MDEMRSKYSTHKVGSGGFVRLVDVMGSEAAIVQAARVSYGTGTKTLSEDADLLRYLMRHRHSTPFEMVELKFHVRVPMDTWRQWIRHRTASVNEYSTRYSEAIDESATTDPTAWRTQSDANKQGSGGYITEELGQQLTNTEHLFLNMSRDVYQERIKLGVAREQARKDLPLSTYTEAYWKIDLHNLLHFLGLRMDSHAQLEIREFATIIGREVVGVLFPVVWQAFREYRLNAITLTGSDIVALREVLSIRNLNVPHLSDYVYAVAVKKFTNKRERAEFVDKVQRFLPKAAEEGV